MKLFSIILLVLGFQLAQANTADSSALVELTEIEADLDAGLDAMDMENATFVKAVNVMRGSPFKWRCYAESRWGDMYSAVHKRRPQATRRALRRCERNTGWRCFRAGCERVISIPF